MKGSPSLWTNHTLPGASVTALCWGGDMDGCFHSVCKKLPFPGFSRLNRPGFEGCIFLVWNPHDNAFLSLLQTGKPSRMSQDEPGGVDETAETVQ